MIVVIGIIWIAFQIHCHVKVKSQETNAMKFLEEMQIFIGEIRHYYYKTLRVDDAIQEVMDTIDNRSHLYFICDGFMKMLQSNFLYDYSNEDDILSKCHMTFDEKIIKLMKSNTYIQNLILELYSMCFITIQYGDREENKKSLYLNNLNYLKYSINHEILFRNKKKYLMSGLFFLSIAPIFFIPVIEKWAIFNMPELVKYYHGNYGKIVYIIIFFVTGVIGYGINTLMKSNYIQSSQYILSKYFIKIKVVNKFIVKIIIHNLSNSIKLHKLILNTYEEITLHEFIIHRCLWSAFVLGLVYVLLGSLDCGMFFLFVSIILGSILGYYIPVLKLKIKKFIINVQKEQELIRMYTIMIMLMNIQSITIEKILIWLRNFSIIYQTGFDECIFDLDRGEMLALQVLIEKEGGKHFPRMIEYIMMCDNVSIQEAFEGLEYDRAYIKEKQDYEKEKIFHDMLVTAKLISGIPSSLVIILHLIIPFVYEAISRLGEYTIELQNIL